MNEELETPIKKFIITDPSYIINRIDYSNRIKDYINHWINRLRTKNPLYEEDSKFPINTTYHKTTDLITIYTVHLTKNGYGTQIFQEQEIKIDSGILCIAENRKGWDETTGALFETLTDAKIALPYIIKNS